MVTLCTFTTQNRTYNTSLYLSTDYGNNWYYYNSTYTNNQPSQSLLSGNGELIYALYYNYFTVSNITTGRLNYQSTISLPSGISNQMAVSFNGSFLAGTFLITLLSILIMNNICRIQWSVSVYL